MVTGSIPKGVDFGLTCTMHVAEPLHTSYQCSKRCYDGCYRCGGGHRVWECDEDYVNSGDSEVEDGSFDSNGKRLQRSSRGQKLLILLVLINRCSNTSILVVLTDKFLL